MGSVPHQGWNAKKILMPQVDPKSKMGTRTKRPQKVRVTNVLVTICYQQNANWSKNMIASNMSDVGMLFYVFMLLPRLLMFTS